mmetsp:Transcript_16940/g.28232  ORF Transcript_16940/g.28232 Transcript_16940/m.28232 type:complete len:286 (+) Transcript_16940:68-925(+)|eukprot:CAMPEP_0119341650 /NCGR_PEP_ID=MMETSP1333-20130426/102924_1 /TAXON_ID=418940 /ORGANISM="Scyphosphaera apsteinii, Strain RCC1455" /LENGTH=285 /DNA_ID=CAMNT_0007353681 /DNA_START=62 /DNA_END=919 /DNA_ORIENTATION=+
MLRPLLLVVGVSRAVGFGIDTDPQVTEPEVTSIKVLVFDEEQAPVAPWPESFYSGLPQVDILYNLSFFPPGVIVGVEAVPSHPFAGRRLWKEIKWEGTAQLRFPDSSGAAAALEAVFKEVTAMKIFSPVYANPTIVSMPDGKTTIELDMEVAITTTLHDPIRTTSLEYITSLDHITGDSFTVTISAAKENIIDGYYRFIGKTSGSSLSLNYVKVQTLVGEALRAAVGLETYKISNLDSVSASMHLLVKYAIPSHTLPADGLCLPNECTRVPVSRLRRRTLVEMNA